MSKTLKQKNLKKSLKKYENYFRKKQFGKKSDIFE